MRRTLWVWVSLAALASGCGAKPKVYWKYPERSVAVLPPRHVKPEAWQTTWPLCEQALRDRGFDVLPRDQVEAFMRENRFTLGDELVRTYSVAELLEQFGTDMVLDTKIDEWDEARTVVVNSFEVALTVELSNAKGRLWAAQGDYEAGSKFSIRGAVLGDAKNIAGKAVAKAFKGLHPVPPPSQPQPAAD